MIKVLKLKERTTRLMDRFCSITPQLVPQSNRSKKTLAILDERWTWETDKWVRLNLTAIIISTSSRLPCLRTTVNRRQETLLFTIWAWVTKRVSNLTPAPKKTTLKKPKSMQLPPSPVLMISPYSTLRKDQSQQEKTSRPEESLVSNQIKRKLEARKTFQKPCYFF